ncbi:MAG: M48 family metallopeptidase [Alphaproteobacteria bacterium]|nr:M48 family metallopeptidase [Alphaproteobacteria bacterium]
MKKQTWAVPALQRFALLTVLVTLAGCAEPVVKRYEFDDQLMRREMIEHVKAVIAKSHADEERLWAVASPILREGVPLCGEAVGVSLGWRLHGLGDYKGSSVQIEAVAEYYGGAAFNTYRPMVKFTVPGGPAEKAGIKAGDIVVKVGDYTMLKGPTAVNAFYREAPKIDLKGKDSIRIVVERNEREISFDVALELQCDFPLIVQISPEQNAFADGRHIVFTTGMLRDASDYHLAIIFGHELAHNAMLHIQKTEENLDMAIVAGTVIDIALLVVGVDTNRGATRYLMDQARNYKSVEFENEADYIGMYFLARAGYEFHDAASLWRFMATHNPDSIYAVSTHPPTPERALALRRTAREIQDLIDRGEEIMPKLPDDWVGPVREKNPES